MIGVIASRTVLAICFLLLVGAHTFDIPLVSPVGATVLSIFGPWLILVPAAIGVFEIWHWRSSRSRLGLVAAVIAVCAVGLASVALARMVAESRDHGVSVSLGRALQVRFLSAAPPDDDLAYGSWQNQELRLVVYKPGAASPAHPAPILLYIHGGGFSVGDRFEAGTNLRGFADKGWLVLSVDYTLSSADRHLWDVTTGQVGCAMAWTASNAARFGGDPARISLVGSSAGGNLAINAAYLANAGKLESSCGGTVPRVSAVSALYPPVDIESAWESRVPVISDMARKFNTYYVGGSPQRFPDRYRFVNSATHISGAAPPTLVIFGSSDHLVPPDATDRFVRQAQNAGIDVESVRFPFADHAFNLNEYGIGNQFFLEKTDLFLREHGQSP